MNEPIETLADAIPREIARCRDLIEDYKSIGPAGAFGAHIIQSTIDHAIQVSAAGDTVGMIRALTALRECKN